MAGNIMYEFKKYVNHTIRQGVMNTKYFHRCLQNSVAAGGSDIYSVSGTLPLREKLQRY